MTFKMIRIVGVGLLIAAVLFVRGCYLAGTKEWELLNRVPTSSVEASKRLGIYITNLNFSPAELDLGDARYRIEKVWAEHRTGAERVNLFTVRQVNQPNIVLCVQMQRVGQNHALVEGGVRISTTKANRTYLISRDMCVDAGDAVPDSFVLSSVARKIKVRIELRRP